MPDNIAHLEMWHADLKHRIYTDGTSTLAQVIHSDPEKGEELLAEGASKRRKGDRRDPDLGANLALARAYMRLATSYLRMAEDKGALR